MDAVSPSRVVGSPAGTLWIADERGRVWAADRDGRGARVVVTVEGAGGLAVTADACTLYVGWARGVLVADVAAGTHGTMAETGGPVSDLALDEEEALLYAAIGGGGVIALSLADGRRRRIAAIKGGAGLALAPDRRRLYATDGTGRVIAIPLPGGEPFTVAEGFARPLAIAVTPAGLALADAGGAALFGVNPRHGTSTAIWRGDPLAAPSGVAFDREQKSYVVADPAAGRLYRIARDGSRADPIALNPAQ